jgi:hypothetical protein
MAYRGSVDGAKKKEPRMSLAVGIAANLILDLALVSALAYVMSLTRLLTPHVGQLASPEIVVRRLAPREQSPGESAAREPDGETRPAVDANHTVDTIGTAA